MPPLIYLASTSTQAGSVLPTALVAVCRARATRTHYFFVNKKACCICSDISVSCMSIAESTSAVFSDLIAPWSWAGPIMSQFLSFSRLLQRSTQHALKGQIRLSSGSVGGEQQQIRRETLFFDPQMQQLLLRLQGRDHTKVVKKNRSTQQYFTWLDRFLERESLRLTQTDLCISS